MTIGKKILRFKKGVHRFYEQNWIVHQKSLRKGSVKKKTRLISIESQPKKIVVVVVVVIGVVVVVIHVVLVVIHVVDPRNKPLKFS